ncbi:MAG: hypothetical protein HPY62_07210 [Bacteroidales bacterium]|nr:hypothetical protein [Bacteroidales bacterium]
MNSPELKAFIRKHSALFWYIPDDKKEDLSPEVLVEFILNYGDIQAVKELISILGINSVAKAFFDSINLSERRKGNFNELTLNFFTIFFSRYAQGNTDAKTE